MNIKHPNYLYRVLGQLEAEGAVEAQGPRLGSQPA